YGPRMRPDDGRVVSNFIVQALTGQDITIYGDVNIVPYEGPVRGIVIIAEYLQVRNPAGRGQQSPRNEMSFRNVPFAKLA
ncbi:hypothetical protein ACC672_37775, partial [Rhizobium ruizarguesonis]